MCSRGSLDKTIMNTFHTLFIALFFVAVSWFVWVHIVSDLPSDFLARFVERCKDKGGK